MLAFGAGIVSFLSPCTLPLLPGYLAYMSGLGADEVRSRDNTNVVVVATILFVLGFSLVFVAEGATASYIGSVVGANRDALTRLAGVFIIVMALVMLGVLQVPILYREKRFHPGREWGVWSSFPLGMAFAFGWTPCIGTILSSIMVAAMTQASVQRGAFLLFVYALGLGVPFLAFAFFADRAFSSLTWFKRHVRTLNLAGGAVLLLMGAFLLTDRWTEVMAPVMRWYSGLGIPS